MKEKLHTSRVLALLLVICLVFNQMGPVWAEGLEENPEPAATENTEGTAVNNPKAKEGATDIKEATEAELPQAEKPENTEMTAEEPTGADAVTPQLMMAADMSGAAGTKYSTDNITASGKTIEHYTGMLTPGDKYTTTSSTDHPTFYFYVNPDEKVFSTDEEVMNYLVENMTWKEKERFQDRYRECKTERVKIHDDNFDNRVSPYTVKRYTCLTLGMTFVYVGIIKRTINANITGTLDNSKTLPIRDSGYTVTELANTGILAGSTAVGYTDALTSANITASNDTCPITWDDNSAQYGKEAGSITFSGTVVFGDEISNKTDINSNRITQTVTFRDVTPLTLVNTGAPISKTYDGGTSYNGASPTLSLMNPPSDISLTGTPTITFLDANAGTDKALSISGLSLTGDGSEWYRLDTSSIKGTITKAAPTISLTATPSSPASFGQPITLNAAIAGAGDTPTGSVTFTTDGLTQSSSLVNGVATWLWTPSKAGSYSIAAQYQNGVNYEPATTSIAYNVTKADQPGMVINDPGTKTYGDGEFTLSTSQNGNTSTGKITYESSDNSILSINGSTATIHKPGTVTITAIHQMDDNYNEIKATRSLTINPRKLEFSSFEVTPKNYDGNTSADYSYNISNKVGNDNIEVAGAITFKDKNTGTLKAMDISGLSVSGAQENYYILDKTIPILTNLKGQITPKTLTVKNLKATDRDYNGSTKVDVTGGTLEGVLSGEESGVILNPVSGIMADKNAGTAKAVTLVQPTLTGAGAANYSVAMPSDALSVNITPKPLGIEGLSAKKVYDGNTGAALDWSPAKLTGILTAEGAAEQDIVSLKQNTLPPNGTYDNKNIGTAKAVAFDTPELEGPDAGNYKLPAEAPGLIKGILGKTAQTSLKVGEITKKPLNPKVSCASKDYDGTTNAAGKFRADSTDMVSGDDLSLVFENELYKDPNAGDRQATAALKVTGADEQNYSYPAAVEAGAKINRKAITVTPKPWQYKYYGENDPVFGYTLPSDQKLTTNMQPLQGQLSRDAGENVKNNYNIKQGTLTNELNPNYDLKLGNSNVNFEIKPAIATFESIETELTYNGQPQSIRVVARGRNDMPVAYAVSYKDKEGKVVDKPQNAGQYTAEVSIADPNYQTKSQTVTLTIKPIAPTVSLEAQAEPVKGRSALAEGNIELKADVAGLAGTAVPTGKVTFYKGAILDSNKITEASLTPSGDGSYATATTKWTPTEAERQAFTTLFAVYGGDTNNAAQTNYATASKELYYNASATEQTLSVSPTSVNCGAGAGDQIIDLTVSPANEMDKITAVSSNPAVATARYDTNTQKVIVTPVGSGEASITITKPHIQAASGGVSYNPVSIEVPVKIGKADSATTLHIWQDPARETDGVLLAQVAPKDPGGAAPTGVVDFYQEKDGTETLLVSNVPIRNEELLDTATGTLTTVNGAKYTWSNMDLGGSYTIIAKYSGSPQYNPSAETKADYQTSKEAQAAISFTKTTAVYGEAPFKIEENVTGGSGSGPWSYTSSNPGIIAIEGGIATVLQAGEAEITATHGGDAQFYEASQTQKIVVAPATAILSLEVAGTSYPSALKLTAKIQSGAGGSKPIGAVTFKYIKTDGTEEEIGKSDLNLEGIAVLSYVPKQAGELNFKAYAAFTGNKYKSDAPADASITLEKGIQAPLTITNPDAISYGSHDEGMADNRFRIQTQGGTGTGALSFESTDPNIISVQTDGTAIIHEVGTVALKAYRSADSNYSQSDTAELSLTVIPKEVSIIPLPDQKQAYNGTTAAPALGYTALGLAGGDSLSGTILSLLNPGKDAGIYTIALAEDAQASNPNYSLKLSENSPNFVIEPRALVIEPKDNQQKTYGSSEPALTYSFADSTNVVGSEVLAEPVLGRTKGEAAGDYAIALGAEAAQNNPNYKLTLKSNKSFSIKKAGTQISVSTDPAGGSSFPNRVVLTAVVKKAGDMAPDGSLSFKNNLSETLPGQVTLSYNENGDAVYTQSWTPEKAAGYLITADYAGNTNYAAGSSGAPVVHNVAQGTQDSIGISTAAQRTYGDGGNAFKLEWSGGSGNGAVTYTSSNPSVISFDDSAKADAVVHKAGQATITVTKKSDANYGDTKSASLEITVAPKVLTVIPDDNIRNTYDGTVPNPNLTFKTQGQVGSDNFENLLTWNKNSAAGTYAIALAADAQTRYQNYVLTLDSAEHVYTIDKRPVTLKPDALSKDYGADEPELTYTLTEGTTLAAGEGLQKALTRGTAEEAGTYTITKAPEADEANPNYAISLDEATVAFTINKVTPMVTLMKGNNGSSVYPEGITLMADVAGVSKGSSPTGTVTFKNGDTPLPGAQDIALENGGAQYIFEPQSAGDYNDLKIEYGGDVNYLKNQAGLGPYRVDKGTLTPPQKELLVYYGSTQTYDLSALKTETELTYSDLKIEDSDSILEGTPVISDDQKLSLKIKDDSKLVDKTATLRLLGTPKAENTYNPVIAEIKVRATDRITPVPEGEIKTTGSLTYGDPLSGLTLIGSFKNLSEGSAVAGKLEWLEPDKVLDAGQDQRVTYRFTPEDQMTYLPTEGELSITVEKAETLMSLDSKEAIYDGTQKPVDKPVMVNKKYPYMAVTPEESEIQYTYTADESFESAKAPKNAGAYKVKADYSGNANYLPAESEAVSLSIVPKDIVVTPYANQKKTYGDENKTLEYSLSAALAKDDSLKGRLSRGSIEDVGQYEINLGSLTAGSNYNLSCASGVMYEIMPAVATIMVAEKLTAVYDGQSHTVKPKVEGVDSNPVDYTVTYLEKAAAKGRKVGMSQEQPVDAGEYTAIIKTTDSNYQTAVAKATIEVAKRPVTVTPKTGLSKIYGGEDPELSYTLDTDITKDMAPLQGKVEREAGENAGTYAINQGSLSSEDNANYDIRFTEGKSLTIHQAEPVLNLETKRDSASVGDAVDLTVTAAGVNPDDNPTGKVDLKAGMRTIANGVLLQGGMADYTWKEAAYGSHDLRVKYQGDANYKTEDSVLTGFDVSKRNQEPLVIEKVENKNIASDPFALSLKGGSGSGDMSYTSTNPQVIRMDGPTAEIVGKGAAQIKVEKAGDDVYNPVRSALTITVGDVPVVPPVTPEEPAKPEQKPSDDKLNNKTEVEGTFSVSPSRVVLRGSGSYGAQGISQGQVVSQNQSGGMESAAAAGQQGQSSSNSQSILSTITGQTNASGQASAVNLGAVLIMLLIHFVSWFRKRELQKAITEIMLLTAVVMYLITQPLSLSFTAFDPWSILFGIMVVVDLFALGFRTKDKKVKIQ